ncbi:hypothetical protein ABBQ38_015324 [Trebouxia sp. C0009 RCD-2024]
MELEERQALGKIVFAMQQYKSEAEWDVTRWERNYSQLSEEHKALLPQQPAKFAAARNCIHNNFLFIKSLLEVYQDSEDSPSHLSSANTAAAEHAKRHRQTAPGDMEKVRYVFKNLMRDWSQEGAPERTQSYGRICQEAQKQLAGRDADNPPRVLVPGAGLGRLCLELTNLGFEVQGNEFSYYMLLTSSFILNNTQRAQQWTVFPWMHSNCNQKSVADQLRGVSVPDVHPGDLVQRLGLLSMCAGDFVEVYSEPHQAGSFDCVATCFFLDTAHNILQYMQIIKHILKDGGCWINLGPLLFHWADAHTYLPEEELSVELSLEEVEAAAKQLGFKTIKREMVPAAYMTNLRSMLKSSYTCVFWTMVKEGR